MLAEDLFGGDVDAVEDVHHGNPENQCGQGWLVVVAGRLVPYLVGHRIGLVAEPGDGLGEGQCGAFGVDEQGCVPPGNQGEQTPCGMGRSCRASTRTSQPLFCSRATTSFPRRPVPPVTRTGEAMGSPYASQPSR